MDETPLANHIVRRWVDKYVFVRDDGMFHKARAMNVGIPFIESDLLLWLDDDLIVPVDFLDKAVAELHARHLDCLVPWTSVRYLSAQDSAEIMGLSRRALDCPPVETYFSRRGACGGAVLVRTGFVLQHGGMCEAFRGWGGEDNAWFYKARLFGRAAVTDRTDQHLYHLFHENSGGYDSRNHIAKNPHYNNNVALLQTIRSITDAAQFLQHFPVPSHYSCPWELHKRVMFVSEDLEVDRDYMERTAHALSALYGIAVDRCITGHDRIVLHEQSSTREPDAIVLFGTTLAIQFLRDTSYERLWTRALIVYDVQSPLLTTEEVSQVSRAGEHLTADNTVAQVLRQAGLQPWPWTGTRLKGAADSVRTALALAQPLSILLNSSCTSRPLRLDWGKSLSAVRGGLPMMTVARTADLSLPEFAAFNSGRDYPVMRRWELPFALAQLRLTSTMAVLDCTINPVDFRERLLSLYPHVLYRYWNPIQGGQFQLPFGVPDLAFDRVICVNTLEHLLQPQREALIAEIARKLKPGGLLVVTCDYYFDWFWERPELLRMGVMRADRGEIFNGWNKVTAGELVVSCAKHGLQPLGDALIDPQESDANLYRNIEPYPHACMGAVFYKAPRPVLPAGKKLLLSLLTWNTRDISLESLQAHVQEAAMLQRLGQEPFIVVCDNGSTDGTQEALRELDGQIDIPHRFILNDSNRGNCIARNQVIDLMLELGGDYLLFTDGDIEIVPFSSFAMLRHMENNGSRLGCLGANSADQTPCRERASVSLYSINGCLFESINFFACTGYGMFRREVFEAGVRFDETGPFNGVGWGFEDNDLAFQLEMKGYLNQRILGMTFLHRYVRSSTRIMREHGIDAEVLYTRRKRYVVDKWSPIPHINNGPLLYVRQVSMNI
jgi:glycosyltransferase involved in cell wall biosynthesis/SAM-dependent methyltransferase